ncbi:MAG: S-layer homology domain-containing protein [Oscillospiraceae bacterium]|nr:S-layer homology domain-containing protein [Oscillospiraceae bacterium]
MTYWTLSPKNSWIPITLYSFTDVKSGAYYYDAVLWAAENEITAGYGSDTTFCPDLACTRAQVVTFLWRAAGEPAPESSANPFTDIQKGWYYDAVLWAAEKGITAGYGSDTTFCPNQECTRAEIVTFLHRYAGLPAPASTSNPFVDVGANKWYTTAVLWAVGEGITNGLGSAVTFCPDTVCNRAQVVTFLYRSVEN